MTKFSSLNPFSELVYFLSVFALIMFNNNPVFSLLALVGGIFFRIENKSGFKTVREIFMLLVFLSVIAITNPLFSHRGVTVLFFLNNNPVTAEAFYYGISLGLMIISVLVWFRNMGKVITDDKLLYLTAKVSPKLSLLISSAFYFIPRLKEKAAQLSNAQKAIGAFSSDTVTFRLKSRLNIYSALVTWGLENAVDKGNSMKARGYENGKKGHYALYTFSIKDFAFLFFTLTLDFILVFLMLKKEMTFSFYPSLEFPHFDVTAYIIYSLFGILCYFPFIKSVKENIKWHYLKSKI